MIDASLSQYGPYSTGYEVPVATPTTAPSGGTDWAGGISSLFSGLGSIAGAAGGAYKTADSAFSNQVPIQQQGATSTKILNTGGQTSSNGTTTTLLIGAAVFVVGILGLLAFKK